MRQVKFRAYDKINHRIRQVSELNLNTGYVWCPTETMPICLHGEQFELLQFTGLLDKRGKEIYEGDLIRFPRGKQVQVFWQRIGLNAVGYATDYSTGKVIGNIYESRDLLEVKDEQRIKQEAG